MQTTANKGGKPVKRNRKRELGYFEKRLLEERRHALKHLERAGETLLGTTQSAGGDVGTYTLHMADQGTDAMEREKAFLFASQEGRSLWHIDEALRRLYQKPQAFGICERCSSEISFERLDIVPHARLCLGCKEREERSRK